MTVVELRHDLAIEVGEILNHMNFKNPQGQEDKINVFEQELPIQKHDDDTAPYPFVLVRAVEGKISENNNEHNVFMILTAGIYEESEERGGETIVLNIINDIIERFRKNPILNKKFVMQQKLEWELQENDTYPYSLGRLITSWTVPLIQREGIYT